MSAPASSASSAPVLPSFPTRFDMEVVPPASRHSFSARDGYAIRLIRLNEDVRFMTQQDITRKMASENKILCEVLALNPAFYLAEYGGVPGFVKGVNVFAPSGNLIINADLNSYTRLCESRVDGNKIKFGYGKKQTIENREDCWEFAIKLMSIKIVTEVHRATPVAFPMTLLRDETKCPVCLDDLSGNVVGCQNNHQVCLPCYNLLAPASCGCNYKRCPVCRDLYTNEEEEKVALMNGIETKEKPYFKLTLKGGNSWKEYVYNEALFFSMIKKYSSRYKATGHLIDTMILSSLYNYAMDNDRKFSSRDFNILYQDDDNNRAYSPYREDYFYSLPPVMLEYVENMSSKEVYDDVAHTQIYIQDNEYTEIDFNNQLENIYGNQAWEINKLYPGTQKKNILRREVYFRYWVKNKTEQELKDYIKNIFKKIIEDPQGEATGIFKYIKIFN